MKTHGLDRLLKLVDTVYYQQEGNKAVCEVLGQADGNCLIITLFVNGRHVPVSRGAVRDILGAHNLSVDGWTTKPQL